MAVARFVVVCVFVLLALPARAGAAVPLSSCGKTTGLECGTVVVPLDRTGATPGTIALHVEVLPAPFARGVMFLLAGGPGQGSAAAFDLGSQLSARFFRAIFPNYTFVAFDNRGTGASGLLDCPALQRAIPTDVDQEAALSRDCADQIGPARRFYATRDHAEDIETVRTALGFGRVALYGVSYGTKLALAYALAHPTAVERIVLDSVLPTADPDPFERNVVQALPQTLQELCADGRCRGVTADVAGDAVAVANALEAKPAVGKVIAPNGAAVTEHVNGEDVVNLIVDSDLSPGLEAELPATLHAARGGYLRPLLRLVYIDRHASVFKAKDLSLGLNVATTCADGQFPWTPDTPPSARGAVLSAAVAAQPAGAFGPFGSWAARLGSSYFCNLWPSPAGRAPLATGPLPDVPMIAFSGGLDFRTPTADAAAVTALFPQGHLVVVPGTGHNVLNPLLPSACPFLAVRNWLDGAVPPATCPRVPAFENPIRAIPRSSPGKRAAATALAAAKTVREGEATWLQAVFSPASLSPAGLFGGKVASSAIGFRLTRYSLVRGVRVSGNVKLLAGRVPFGLRGTIRVTGPTAAAGSLHIAHGRVSGTLGGRRVSAPL